MPSVSVIILTYNEEANLPACLESLKGLECEVFVVDSGSTDRTVEIAKRYGARVFQHPFEGYAAQRNWAQQNLPIQSEWVLHLDADEQLTPELVKEINKILQVSPQKDGFLLCRRTIFMGRWIRHGGHYPSYHLRLFRKDKGRCETRLYDQHFIVDGELASLKHDYLNIITSDLRSWMERHLRWAELEAQEVVAQASSSQIQPKLLGTPIQRKRWLKSFYYRFPIFLRPFIYLIYRYFLRLGFLDGVEGLIFHFLQGFWFRFLVDVNIYKVRKFGERR